MTLVTAPVLAHACISESLGSPRRSIRLWAHRAGARKAAALTSTVAPFDTRYVTISVWPMSAAKWIADRPAPITALASGTDFANDYWRCRGMYVQKSTVVVERRRGLTRATRTFREGGTGGQSSERKGKAHRGQRAACRVRMGLPQSMRSLTWQRERPIPQRGVAQRRRRGGPLPSIPAGKAQGNSCRTQGVPSYAGVEEFLGRVEVAVLAAPLGGDGQDKDSDDDDRIRTCVRAGPSAKVVRTHTGGWFRVNRRIGQANPQPRDLVATP